MEGFGSISRRSWQRRNGFMVLIQETRAKAEEACWLPVLIQKTAGRGSDAAVVLEVCKKAATAATAVSGGDSDATAASEVCKVADVMHKEVAALADLIQEGAMEDKAYQPPILILASTSGDFGGGMCGLIKRYLSLYLPSTNVFLSCNENAFNDVCSTDALGAVASQFLYGKICYI